MFDNGGKLKWRQFRREASKRSLDLSSIRHERILPPGETKGTLTEAVIFHKITVPVIEG
jgi:hypothetical protein